MNVEPLRQMSTEFRLEARAQLALSKGEKQDPHRDLGEWLLGQADRLDQVRKGLRAGALENTNPSRRGL